MIHLRVLRCMAGKFWIKSACPIAASAKSNGTDPLKVVLEVCDLWSKRPHKISNQTRLSSLDYAKFNHQDFNH